MTHQYRVDPAEHSRLEARAEQAIARAERAGDHLWVAMTAFLLADPEPTTLLLDRENLLTYPVIGCYRCEEPFTERQRRRRCPGEPKR